MRIKVNGVDLFVDIEGAGLVPDGPRMRAKPTLILLHGGPGADHAVYKPAFSQLSDVAQIVYFDHRGNGRSDESDAAHWTLDQWADDLRGLIDSLGIENPIIYGASMGGFVAQAFATKYPDLPGALILCATTARVDFDVIRDAFTRVGGTKAGEIAHTYWSDPTPERRRAYFEHCLPLYAQSPPDPDRMARVIVKNPVAMHFNGPKNEMGRFDFRQALGAVTCPTLVISGSHDPIMPPVFGETLLASLGNAPATHHTLHGAGHMIEKDQPADFFALLRHFISENTPCD